MDKKIEQLFNYIRENVDDSISIDDIVNTGANWYEVIPLGMEYKVCTEDERLDAIREDVEDTISYFNADFLAYQTDLPVEVFEALVDNNYAVYKLVEKTCGIDDFIQSAVDADGFGHFLSGYDGVEIKLPDYFAYRN